MPAVSMELSGSTKTSVASERSARTVQKIGRDYGAGVERERVVVDTLGAHADGGRGRDDGAGQLRIDLDVIRQIALFMPVVINVHALHARFWSAHPVTELRFRAWGRSGRDAVARTTLHQVVQRYVIT